MAVYSNVSLARRIQNYSSFMETTGNTMESSASSWKWETAGRIEPGTPIGGNFFSNLKRGGWKRAIRSLIDYLTRMYRVYKKTISRTGKQYWEQAGRLGTMNEQYRYSSSYGHPCKPLNSVSCKNMAATQCVVWVIGSVAGEDLIPLISLDWIETDQREKKPQMDKGCMRDKQGSTGYHKWSIEGAK